MIKTNMRDGKEKKRAGGNSGAGNESVRSMGDGKSRDLFAEDANRSINMHSDPLVKSTSEEDFFGGDRYSSASAAACSPGYFSDRSASTMNYSQASSADSSPFSMSPWNHQPTTNPFFFSATGDATGASTAANPEEKNSPMTTDLFPPGTGLIGSLVREEGHTYSLAATRDLLYTGSDSKNIRVWKDQKEFSGFKSSSGLVKAILISSDRRVFTGHQDGKIRVWKVSPKNPRVHKRVGTLPRLKDLFKSSMKPSNYVDVRRRHQRSAVWIKHTDAVSCLCLSEDENLLYSGSWDRTLKVWRLEDLRCIESVNAHDDAVNAVTAAFGGLVFTGSADGTVKVWRREDLVKPGKGKSKGLTRHVEAQTLVRLEVAVTALAINVAAGVVYGGSSDGGVSWWDRGVMSGAAAGRSSGASGASGVLQGHKVAVLCLAAAGSLVFSGSADATISVWRRDDTGLHTCLSVLTGHAGPVKCLAVAADTLECDVAGGRWVVYSGSLDKSIKVWKVADPTGGSSDVGATAARTGCFGHPDAPRFDMF